jgi:hypothetical protein
MGDEIRRGDPGHCGLSANAAGRLQLYSRNAGSVELWEFRGAARQGESGRERSIWGR